MCVIICSHLGDAAVRLKCETDFGIQREQQASLKYSLSMKKEKEKRRGGEKLRRGPKNVSEAFDFDLKSLCALALRARQLFPFFVFFCQRVLSLLDPAAVQCLGVETG